MNDIAEYMNAMVTMKHGGLDVLKWHEKWPTPQPKADEVLVRVKACGLNNTDINTRTGWYSKAVSGATSGDGYQLQQNDPAWGGTPIGFPRIQGADVCGIIVAVGTNISVKRIGERIISDNWLRDPQDPLNKNKVGYFGSERDGGFAEYTTMPSQNALMIKSDFSDCELATFSCSYSTAEGMLHRADVTRHDTVLVTGASGGVGSALIQLAKLRGTRVIAMANPTKHTQIAKLSPDKIIDRAPDDLRAALGDEKITVVADVVGGDYWPNLIEILERGGRYTCSGAIAGPHVSFDLRTFYLNDLTFTGSTVIEPIIMRHLVRYIERQKIKPMLAKTYPLRELREAQTAFIAKKHTGNIVVTP
ncbi:MAG: alcohol dehydrogenase family protein [Pseudomonadota bacterium]